MNDRSKYDRLCYAMHLVEEQQSSDDRQQVIRELCALGWQGGTVWPGVMAGILDKVSPLLMDSELRKQNLRGYGEDIQ